MTRAFGDVSPPVVPQLPQTTTLTITATATDDNGNTTSAETTLTVVRTDTVQFSKSLANGNAVELSGLVATTSSSDFKGVFYAQQPNRSSGIGIIWRGSVNRGDVVTVTGVVVTMHGERFVFARTVETVSTQQ